MQGFFFAFVFTHIIMGITKGRQPHAVLGKWKALTLSHRIQLILYNASTQTISYDLCDGVVLYEHANDICTNQHKTCMWYTLICHTNTLKHPLYMCSYTYINDKSSAYLHTHLFALWFYFPLSVEFPHSTWCKVNVNLCLRLWGKWICHITLGMK